VAVIDIPFDVEDSPTLGEFLACDDFIRLIVGPVGSGKSSACVMELLFRAMMSVPLGKPEPDAKGKVRRLRRSRFAVIRNTYPELRDTTIKTFESWVPAALREKRAQENAYIVRFNDVESEVLFRALDQPDDAKKLLSLELTGAYINEAKEVPKGIFDLLATRVGRYPALKDLPEGSPEPWCGIWMDTNPPDNDHWLYKLFEEQKPPKHRLFRQPGGRTPQAENRKNLRADYYETISLGKDKDWISVMVDGNYGFVKTGKPVYNEYLDAVHCVEFPALRTTLTLGLDFGLTPAAVIVQRDPGDGQLQVVDEFVTEDMGAVRFASMLATKLKSEYPGQSVTGHGDPAGEQRAQTDERTPFDIVHGQGLPVNPAPTNDFTLRREAVAGLLMRMTMTGRPALVIHPRCKTLRKAMQGGYYYRRVQVTGVDRFVDVPEKNRFSHVAEALQYACVGLGEDRRVVSAEDGEARKVRVRFKSIRAYNGE
jgi:hypothetical protein